MKKGIYLSLLAVILIILFFPFSIGTLKDGGTKVYSALTYKIVRWNRIYNLSLYTEDFKTYNRTAFFFFPENLKDMDLLWEKEQNNFMKSLGEPGVGRNKNIEEIGKASSNNKNITISLKGADLQSEKPYIEVNWENFSGDEASINPYEFEILYCDKREIYNIESYRTCSVREISIPLPALIIPPNEEVSQKYYLDDYNLFENEGQYCFMVRTGTLSNGRNLFAKLYFTLSE